MLAYPWQRKGGEGRSALLFALDLSCLINIFVHPSTAAFTGSTPPPRRPGHVSLFPFEVRQEKKRFRVLTFDYAVVMQQFGGISSREPAEVPLEVERRG